MQAQANRDLTNLCKLINATENSNIRFDGNVDSLLVSMGLGQLEMAA